MSVRKRRWILGILAGLAIVAIGIFIAAYRLIGQFEPMVRDQAIKYLEGRFHSNVELAALHIHLPKMSAFSLVRTRGRGTTVAVDGEGLSMRFSTSPDVPPMFSVKKLSFVVDLGTLFDERKTVESVSLEGMQIHVPPKGSGSPAKKQAQPLKVLVKDVRIKDAALVILPKDRTKKPLQFQIDHLHLTSVANDSPMKYDAGLTIPKPPGQVHSGGTFGPWNADEPGDSPLKGNYTFENADLGIFNGIAGILSSKGNFDGTLDSVHARGEATVPDFRLKMAENRVPLWTSFEVLVDGTNGNTHLQPVKAKLGSTYFTTTGAVIKHENDERRTINLKVAMPNGDLRDLLRLAMRGSPFMEGHIKLNTSIDIPPLSSKVKQKLDLDGTFDVRDAKFLRSTIQDQLDQLSRRGQGQPTNQEIDEVVSHMKGRFRLDNQIMTFKSLVFGVPGADVAVAGTYDLNRDDLDFHGTLKLVAKVSQTQTGWKRWALKPVDPFFAKNGAGTFAHIKIEGPSRKPKFGLDRGRKDNEQPQQADRKKAK